jgi:hypothetical protein
MKNFLLVAFVLLLSINSFGKYGSGIIHSSTTPASNQALSGIPLDGTKAYSYDYYSTYFLSMDLPLFDNISSYNYSYPMQFGGLDFNNKGDLICITTWSPSLFIQDYKTSTISYLGNVSGISLDDYSGLAWDGTNEIMYGIGFNWSGSFGINSSTLFAINLNTLSATVIGVIPGVDVCLSLAFDANNNQLYTIDLNNGNLIRINPANASSTVVGNTGLPRFEVFLESDFNDLNSNLILSMVTPSNNSNIWKVNPNDASLTLLATVPGTMLLTAINTLSSPVPVKWYYFLLVFFIPIALIVLKRLF